MLTAMCRAGEPSHSLEKSAPASSRVCIHSRLPARPTEWIFVAQNAKDKLGNEPLRMATCRGVHPSRSLVLRLGLWSGRPCNASIGLAKNVASQQLRRLGWCFDLRPCMLLVF